MPLDRQLAEENARCLGAVANALLADPGLIGFLKALAPQWGSSLGKMRAYRGLQTSGLVCILRVDSRVAILLNERLYSLEGPSPQASHLAQALRHPQIDGSGREALISGGEDLPDLRLRIEQYADEAGQPVDPNAESFHHRVISLTQA